jgi:hypothetical protein
MTQAGAAREGGRTKATVTVDADLLAAARQHARRTSRTLSALVDNALRLFLTLDRRTDGRATGEPRPRFGPARLELDEGADLVDLTDGPP